MNFDIPSDGWLMFTKSNCSYCKKAKALVPDAAVVLCDTYLDECREAFLETMDKYSGTRHRTFPMIFHDGKFVGGYSELIQYREELQAFALVEF